MFIQRIEGRSGWGFSPQCWPKAEITILLRVILYNTTALGIVPPSILEITGGGAYYTVITELLLHLLPGIAPPKLSDSKDAEDLGTAELSVSTV